MFKQILAGRMIAPKIVDTIRVDVDGLSLANDSGWRPSLRQHIDELKALFKAGEYPAFASGDF